jgi:hypothetical protein
MAITTQQLWDEFISLNPGTCSPGNLVCIIAQSLANGVDFAIRVGLSASIVAKIDAQGLVSGLGGELVNFTRQELLEAENFLESGSCAGAGYPLDCLVTLNFGTLAIGNILTNALHQRVTVQLQIWLGANFSSANHPNTSQLFDLYINVKNYWRRNDQTLPVEMVSFATALPPGATFVHPAELPSVNLARYMRAIVELDRQRWITIVPWDSSQWGLNIATYLPDLNPVSSIISVDPFDPQPFVVNYPTEIMPFIIPGLFLPRSSDGLPYLPSSAITFSVSGREALAASTLGMWNEVGILDTVEKRARWINAHEHSIFGGTSQQDQNARKWMLEFIHFTYWRNIPTGKDRDVVFVSAWSVALFVLRSNQFNDRTYEFLKITLTPTEELDPPLPVFGSDVSTLNWMSASSNQYSLEMQNWLGMGAARTVGSQELSQSQIDTLRQRGPGSGEANGFVTEIIGESGSLFLMTENQFNNVPSP